MTFIKGMGLGINYPSPQPSQESQQLDIPRELRTHNDLNQGYGVRNRLGPYLSISIEFGTHHDINQGNGVRNSLSPPKHQSNPEIGYLQMWIDT